MFWFEILASFEGDEGGGTGNAGAGAGAAVGAGIGAGAGTSSGGAGAGAGAGTGTGVGERTFTQEDVNKFLAEDRRKHQEKYTSLEASYQELLKNQNLTKEERDKVTKEYEDLQARHRTKEQQLAYERKQEQEKYEAELTGFKSKAETWEKRYTESTIHTALMAAAVKHDAFNPSQVIVQLRGMTELVEVKDAKGQPTGELSPMVTMTVKNDETGVSERLQMTPDEAVEYMKKNPAQWGNFFKNNIREGIGSTNATGGALTGNGNVDHSRLSDDQWFKLRRENPAALGLKPRG